LRHILVVNDQQHLVGVVSKNDMFDLQRSGVREISQEICDASDLPSLRLLADRVRQTGMTMIAQGVSAGPLTYFLSSLNDLLTIRVIELTASQFELPNTKWCWLAFGSEGRFEQTFSTDQDNGLVFLVPKGHKAEAIRKQFLPFCQAVNQRLDACGFTLCTGNIMAGNPTWCLSLDEWQKKFSSWVRVPEPEALLNATIFFDFRPLHGEHELAQRMWDDLSVLTQATPLFLHMMAKNALEVEPPIGFLRDFVTADNKGHEGTVDLKKNGVRLFVDAARIFSLATGLWQTNTAYRLRHAGIRVGMAEKDINAIVQGLYYIQRIRLRNQCREIDEGVEPTNFVAPDQLNEIDRRVLKESFKQAKKLQNRLKLDYHL
jgi:CBS domain-containing protein